MKNSFSKLYYSISETSMFNDIRPFSKQPNNHVLFKFKTIQKHYQLNLKICLIYFINISTFSYNVFFELYLSEVQVLILINEFIFACLLKKKHCPPPLIFALPQNTFGRCEVLFQLNLLVLLGRSPSNDCLSFPTNDCLSLQIVQPRTA